MWILTEKVDEGDMNRVKSRLLVLLNIDEGLTLVQTWFPTFGNNIVRLLLALAPYSIWEAVMIDPRNAYFQAERLKTIRWKLSLVAGVNKRLITLSIN